MTVNVKARALRIGIALDIALFAVATLGGARRNETASSAAWSLELDGKWQGKLFRPFIDKLFWFDPGHCESSWKNEQK